MSSAGAAARHEHAARAEALARPGASGELAALEVVVLHGGASGEREVSLQSGAQIARSLAADDGRGPARVHPVEISATGSWLVAGEELDARDALAALPKDCVVFLGLHGGAGEDGTLQGLLTAQGRLHTGSGVAASALCMDKLASRALARELGLAVAPGVCLFAGEEFRTERLEGIDQGTGWAVKPRRGGSSVATFVLAPGEPLGGAVESVFATGDDCLLEAAVVGVEVSCGVLGNRGEPLTTLPPVEIQPADGRFFDYQQKYASDGARERCPVVSLDAGAVAAVERDAALFYAAAGCDGYARIDFIVPPTGRAVLLEANTLPGFTARSLLPLEALEVGLDHRDLCLHVLESALRAGSAR